MSHTYATMEVSAQAFAEIRERLVEANYHHAIHTDDDGSAVLDMHGIGLTTPRVSNEEANELQVAQETAEALAIENNDLRETTKRQAEIIAGLQADLMKTNERILSGLDPATSGPVADRILTWTAAPTLNAGDGDFIEILDVPNPPNKFENIKAVRNFVALAECVESLAERVETAISGVETIINMQERVRARLSALEEAKTDRASRGCICPVGSVNECGSILCPRKGLS